MNLDKRLSKLEVSNEPVSLFDAYGTYVLVDTHEKYEYPERFKQVLDSEDGTDKFYKLVRK